MEVTIFSGNLRADVLEVCRSVGYAPRHFEMQDINVHIYLDDVQGALQKAVTTNPLLKQQMMAAGRSVVGDMATVMAHAVAMAEKEITDIDNDVTLLGSLKQAKTQNILSRLPNQIEAAKQYIQPKVQNAAMAAWQEYCRDHSEYRQYQFVAVVKIGAGVFKIIFSAVHIGASAGATLAVGIVGIACSAVEVFDQIYDLSKEAEKVEEEVFNSVAATLKNRHGTKWDAAKFSLGTIGRKVIPANLLDKVVDSPVKCEELNKLYKHKVQGLDVKSHELAIKLNEALEKSDQLEDALKEEEQKRMSAIVAATPPRDPSGRRGAMSLGNLPNPQQSAQAQKLEKLQGVINDQIIRVETLSQRVNTGRELHDIYAAYIEDLKRDMPRYMPQIAEAFGFAANVLLSAVPAMSAAAAHEAIKPEEWHDIILDASGDLAETFGPEAAHQAKMMIQKVRHHRTVHA